MCTQPRIIKNPRKRFIPYVDSPYLTVPCGECLECRNVRRNEMFVKSWYEHLQAIDNGGFTQFFTLTYNDTYRPHCCGRTCFSRKDIKEYFMRVTSRCKRTFGESFKFRRLVTCERGKSTGREHYHFLVFVQQPCNHYVFRKILKECWPFGFSFGSWDNFGEVNRVEGIRYVTKYVSKDMFDSEIDNEVYKELRIFSPRSAHNYRLSEPFTFTSKSFGVYAIAHLLDLPSRLPTYLKTPLDLIIKEGVILAPTNNNSVGKVPIPRSLERLLFFTPTYRKKSITKSFINKCLRNGTDVPKYRVQSFYIPKVGLYYDYFHFKNVRKFSKVIECDRAYTGADTLVSPLDSRLPVDVLCLRSSSNSVIKDYLDYEKKVCDIMCERDPIFERCPFTGVYSFRRAPLERTEFPELESYCADNYVSSDFLSYFVISNKKSIGKYSKIPEYNSIEKTINDYRKLNEL